MFFKYLGAAFGSALISSIYGIVDMAMVGQYQGPEGTAALAVVAPVWNILYSLGLLTGIGGSVLLGSAKGKGDGRENEFFTAALYLTVILSAVSWAAVAFFDKPLLILFGAEETLLPLAQSYLLPIKFTVPLFIFNQMLAAFLRNDNAPALATAAVLAGGIFNVFGDYFFVFGLDMGIFGAGLATATGAAITFIVMLSHFFTKKNSLKLTQPSKFMLKCKQIAVIGFSSFFIDVAMGILTILFNRQIMSYLGADALSVYGIIINISTIVQCCAYSVGQAAQPILSVNYGAGASKRIKQTLKYGLYTAALFALFWTTVMLALPSQIVGIFMMPTDAITGIAPGIMRTYGISFLLLPLNIFSTYYFQSLMKVKASFFISVLRGILLSGLLIFVLPIIFGAGAIWLTMPVTEAVTVVFVIILMYKYNKRLPKKARKETDFLMSE